MGIFNFFKSKKIILKENTAILIENEKKLIDENNILIRKRYRDIPLIQANNKLFNLLSTFQIKRKRIEQKWDVTYKNFSLWNKLKYPEKLDLSNLDKQIKELEDTYSLFEKKYKNKIKKIDDDFNYKKIQNIDRIRKTCKLAIDICKKGDSKKKIDDDFFIKSFWLGILSIPISIGNDFYTAHNIYDALRKVNGNFSQMSDLEIFWETLWMSDKSLIGLSSLAKGAYFESLVANDTGGKLFEHFNHLDTDIIIDNVEMQIKATDSISYIESVDDNILVIATTEVAIKTGAIDGGYTNEELSNSIDLALGGTVVNLTDTAIDAILTSAGSLGFFATLRGINHAQKKFDKGMDGVEAIFEGAGVAIEGTAKGVVDASEMFYNVATSKPSKFVGNLALKGLRKIDEKI